MNALQRFWSHVERESADSCWPWTGFRNSNGYGFTNSPVKTTAHRMAYMLAVGPIPEGKVVMHLCDNPPCCNPHHLRAVTQEQNLADMRSKGRAGDCRVLGEAHGMCKLTDVQVAEIRSLYATGDFTHVRLARRFHVGLSQIGRIVRCENRAVRAAA